MKQNDRKQSFCDLLILGTIVTMDGNYAVIDNGAVAVRKDSIVDVGYAPELEKKYEVEEIIEIPRGVVLPGLINGHVQFSMTGLDPAGSKSQKKICFDEVVDIVKEPGKTVLSAIAQMIKTGTTSFCNMSECSGEVAAAAKYTGIRYLSGEVLSDSTTTIVDWQEAFLSQEKKMVHCPANISHKASCVTPIPQLLNQGIKIGLGTGTGSMHNYDLFIVMDMNSKLHKVHALDSEVMTARQTLSMATRGGAEAFGVNHLIGSIEIGKKADLLVLDFDQPHLTPVYDFPSHLVYAARGSDVIHSIINGRVVMRNRRIFNAQA